MRPPRHSASSGRSPGARKRSNPMTEIEPIRAALRREPFRPFVIECDDHSEIEVTHCHSVAWGGAAAPPMVCGVGGAALLASELGGSAGVRDGGPAASCPPLVFGPAALAGPPQVIRARGQVAE